MRLLSLIATLSLSLSLPVFADEAPKSSFKDESELGIATVGGNSSTETYNAKQMNEYDWNKDVAKINFRYLNTRTSGTDTARNWDGGLRYERVFSDYLNGFTSYGWESDIFQGFVQRNNFDLGAKYFLAKSDDTTWSVEAGYRNSVTHYPTSSQPDNINNSLRIYTEGTQKWGKTTTFKLWIEYIPAISSNLSGTPGYSVGQDYLVNSEPSVTTLLNDVFSLKVAYLMKYVNYIPPTSTATKNMDTVFTTSLVAKF